MAIHKVAQDVEADDKLIGPFSFRQFIYLIVVAMAIALAWGLSQIFVGLAVLPLPIILVFGAMALPLKKDQPMETYLAAIVAFRLKPRKRLWVPDGIESLVEITAPKSLEEKRTKDLSSDEAERRLSYLADIADSRGWSIRRTTAQPDTSMSGDSWNEAQATEDLFDDQSNLGNSLSAMISKSDQQRRSTMIQKMQQASAMPTQPQPTPQPAVQSPLSTSSPPIPASATIADPQVQMNPYPNAIHQSVIQPLNPDDHHAPSLPTTTYQTATAPQSMTLQPQSQTSTPTLSTVPTARDSYESVLESGGLSTSNAELSPGIINLAHNSDLSIETIQREADRIQKQSEEDEVYIPLH